MCVCVWACCVWPGEGTCTCLASFLDAGPALAGGCGTLCRCPWLRQDGDTNGAIFLGCEALLPCPFHRTGHLAEETRAVWCVLCRGSQAGRSRGPMLGLAVGLPALLPHTGLGGRAQPAHGAVQRVGRDPYVKNLSGLGSPGLFRLGGSCPLPWTAASLRPQCLSSPLSSFFVFLRRSAPLSSKTNDSAKEPSFTNSSTWDFRKRFIVAALNVLKRLGHVELILLSF